MNARRLPAGKPCPWTELDADGQSLELENFLSLKVVRLANTLQRLSQRDYLEPHGLTSPEWRILGYLRRFEPAPFGSVSEYTLMDKAQVSRSVKRLQAQGLVTASGDDSHAQRLLLGLTPRGHELHERIRQQAARIQVALLSRLAPAQREALWHSLHVLLAAAGEQPLPQTAARTRAPTPTRQRRTQAA